MGWKRIGLMRRPAAGGEARSRASFLLFFLFFQPQNTGGKNGDNGNSVGYGNPECSIHKKRLRNNVYQQIRGRIQNPQVISAGRLLGVDQSLYEAANADGAGRFKRIWHITLPGIRTTVALLAILSLGNVLNAGFDQIYNLYNPLVYSTGDIIDTWVYRAGLENLQYSLATAVGLFKSVISVILIVIGYKLADKFTGYKLF